MDLEKKSINPGDEALSVEAQDIQDNDLSEIDEEFPFDTENSTIFSKNTEYKNTKKAVSAGKKKLRGLIALVVVAAVVGAGIFGIIKFIPKTDGSDYDDINIIVKQVDTNSISKIVVNNSKGELTLSSIVEDDGTVTWGLDGYDTNLVASSSVNLTADSVATISAARVMHEPNLDYKDYGLDSPAITAEVYMRDGSGDYTVSIGKAAPDKTGYYLSVSGDSKVYLVTQSEVSGLDIDPESLAIRAILNAPTKTADTKASDRKYFDDDGNIATFDSIELSGALYDKDIAIVPISNNEMVEYTVAVGNEVRYANSEVANEAFGLLSNGIVAIEAYKLNPSQNDIKAYGLDKPDAVIKFKYGSQSVVIRARYYDEENGYYAAMIDGLDGIYAISKDVLTILDYPTKDFYNEFVFLEYLKDFSNITVKTPDKSYSFNVQYDEEEEEFTADMGGKPIDASLLSAYYAYYTVLSPEIKDSYIEGAAALTATFTYVDSDKGKKVIELVKQSDRRYLVVIDGKKMGVVTSLDFEHLVDYAQYVVDEKGIPDAS